jgi:hypothetical protein
MRISLPKADIPSYISNRVILEDGNIKKICSRVIKYYKLSLREILNYSSMIETVIYELLNAASSDVTEYVIGALFIPTLVGAYYYDYSTYSKFINGESCEDIIKILNSDDVAEEIGHFLYSDHETFSERYATPEIDLIRFDKKLYGLWTNIMLYADKKDVNIRYGKINITGKTKNYLECMLAGMTDCAEYSSVDNRINNI